jgi:hypothetical protein
MYPHIQVTLIMNILHQYGILTIFLFLFLCVCVSETERQTDRQAGSALCMLKSQLLLGELLELNSCHQACTASTYLLSHPCSLVFIFWDTVLLYSSSWVEFITLLPLPFGAIGKAFALYKHRDLNSSPRTIYKCQVVINLWVLMASQVSLISKQ